MYYKEGKGRFFEEQTLCCDKTDSIMLDKLVLLENHYVLRILKYVGAGASFF